MIKWYGVKRNQHMKGQAFPYWGMYLKWEVVKRAGHDGHSETSIYSPYKDHILNL